MSDLTRGITFTGNIPTAAAAHTLVDNGSINKEFITAKTVVDCASTDKFVICDASDGYALKSTTGLSILNAISGATGSALIVAGSSQAALAALGATTIGSVMVTAGSVGAVFTALGITDTGSALAQAVNSGSARNTIGFTGNVPALNYQIFTASGSFVKGNLPSHATHIIVEGWGAGGGGGGGNTSTNWRGVGGGGGGYFRKRIATSDLAASVTVTVGSAGIGGAAGNPGSTGTSGGETNFSTNGSATGGVGGTGGASAAAAGVNPGLGCGGDLNLYGDASDTIFTNSYPQVSRGGNAPFFNGVNPNISGGAYNYGCGGTCGNHTSGNGGNGGGGLVIVSW